MNTAIVYTDASYHSKLKRGGYGIIILYLDKKIEIKGEFNEPPKTPTDAEIKSCLNAVSVLSKLNPIPEKILIKSDCYHVIDIINEPDKKTNYQSGNQLQEALKSFKVEAEHLPSHNNGFSEDEKLFNICHEMSRKYLSVKKNYKTFTKILNQKKGG